MAETTPANPANTRRTIERTPSILAILIVCLLCLVLIFGPEFRHRRIWHVDQEGRVATPIDFTATLSYVNFLNHSDQARATACLLPTAYCLLPAAYCLLPTADCLLPTTY